MSGAPQRTRPRLLDTACGVLLLLAVLLVHAIDRRDASPRAVGRPEEKNLLGAPSSTEVAEVTPAPPPAVPLPPPRPRPKKVAPPPQAQAKVQAPTPSPAPKQPERPPVALQVRRSAPEVVNSLLTQPGLNKFGNPEGTGLGLARPGEFKGARLLAWSVCPEDLELKNIFTADNPLWAALKDKGFEVRTKGGRFQSDWLRDTDQLWIVASGEDSLTVADVTAIIAFVNDGKGLYLLADNDPYVTEACQIVRKMYGSEISGNFAAQKLFAVRGHGVTRDDFRRSGLPKNFKADEREKQSLLAVIEKAVTYVDEHPLLTDVNFIYEGHSVSHINPTQSLQPVLTASDGQILSAVSVDPRQRIVVDCGFTRYYYGPHGHFVTETAGTLQYAENIAAYLMGKDDKGGDGSKWQERRALLAKYRDAAESEVLAGLRSANPDVRWAALTAAYRRRLNLPEPLVGLIDDARLDISGLAHKALVQPSNGWDYGPPANPTAAEREVARKGWETWLKRVKLAEKAFSLPETDVVAMLGRPDPDERWAGVVVTLRRRLDLPDLLIGLLRDPNMEIRLGARQALVQLAASVDFGPAPEATDLELTTAIENWHRWRVSRKNPDLGRNAPAKVLSAAVHSTIPDERWAAVLAIRQRRLMLVLDLIDALSDTQVLIQQDARQTLKLLASTEGQDHGPQPGATPEAIEEAKDGWKTWWDSKAAKLSAQMMTLARALHERNPAEARRRYREVIETYPGSAAASEAQVLLKTLR